ncbi:hypothetical protein [Streptomyces niveus]|uniref:hypothetical protein n=1 Tax=Streptomyces niveus TaxID=193462 RepID=UPI003431D98B
MSKANTHRLDREIQLTERKLEAVRRGEMWPLTASERRRVMTTLVGGSYRVVRGKSTGRAERQEEQIALAVETRLIAELTALQSERQRLITEAAQATAAKKSSGWW